ncbi:major capsid protein [Blackfly microvirus SF02]|uniref:Major capsid protein n=1 Tax=Blackfly microvirus SF02 TaxID=2576452 RepID=A0A4P8PKM2_9VIRU|nr:major capsid protein [Blackfly microvirus SF02]
MARKNTIFQSAQVRRPERSKFDLSHEVKLTMGMGKLIPIYLEEILPGDSFRANTEIFLRMQPLLAPIMHRVNCRLDFFFVPTRIIWDEFEDFITGGPQGNLAPVAPYFNLTSATQNLFDVGTLCDYFGLPNLQLATVNAANNQKISSLPFRAYQTIYNEYYRDQSLITEIPVPLTSGDDTTWMTVGDADGQQIRQRAWEKDYFTSALPWAQRGASVGLPFGTSSVVYRTEALISQNSVSVDPVGTISAVPFGAADGVSKMASAGGIGQLKIDNIQSIALSGTINDLRRSLRLQEWLEKSAIGGARYIEQNRIHFGVNSSDARLQRPEYLGGGKSAIQISEVLSTVQQVNPADGEPLGNPQGTMAGHGISFSGAGGFRRSFEEHGHVVGIFSVIPVTAYQQGIARSWQRFDKFDYAWPEFAHIGEQAVLNREVYFTGVVGDTPNATFGYQSRYSEMKYRPSYSCGDMRASLDFWNMDRIFNAQPGLNEAFISSDPTTRVFAVDNQEYANLIVQVYHKVDALRPLPYYGTPML